MPPKKAAKKTAKKHLELEEGKHGSAGRKHPHSDKKHKGKKHREDKDLRRAYEHLGRLSALEKNLTARSAAQIKVLTNLAQKSLFGEDPKSAADLLRAAEHLAFGSLAQTSRATRISEALEDSINAELTHLAEKAAEHWKKHQNERPAEISDLYDSMLSIAETSRVKGAYRRALEFARGAEALAHVRTEDHAQSAMLRDNSVIKLSDDPE